MPFIYKTDLVAPQDVEPYKSANAVGSQIVLPDIKNPEKRITYTIEEIEVNDAGEHPQTKEPLKSVTLTLKEV